MTFYYDFQRHLVCVPYSVENLHKMAAELGISRHWLDPNPYPHYDIPLNKLQVVAKKCQLVRPRDILSIVKGQPWQPPSTSTSQAQTASSPTTRRDTIA